MANGHVSTSQLGSKLQACSQQQGTQGRLDIKAPKGYHWSLYFDQGHIIGDAGGVHPARRLYRLLSQYSQLSKNAVSLQTRNGVQCWNYNALASLVRHNYMIREQMVAVVKASIAEVLFEIMQYEELHCSLGRQLTYSYVSEDRLYASPLVYIQTEGAWQQSKSAWENWKQAGLLDYSPHLAPAIRHEKELQQQTSLSVYRSLTSLMNGERTLRDLALKLRQDPLVLTQSIVPYIRKGFIQLVEIADLSSGVERFTVHNQSPPRAARSNPTQPRAAAPLVAYIDDSSLDGKIMGQIVSKTELRYINIQDSVQALPILLEQRPNLIFLDLVMPIANGYEICAQLRRTSLFKDTPIIIVTGNDGIVDRVRAKVVRASDFIAKPIEAKKVLTVLQKYLLFPHPAR